ncbi:GGDEF domain-containing protein [Shewanella youngdeokensis]|uniref:GGDEF domain-containing protein n=1 Tax=Shewanella youngdeokensis TaxID=2999068 RepID=A0ABZ0K2C4_9GAMM|nr:GGDEF domain-containing protein [Shewanella sp. DAU334]
MTSSKYYQFFLFVLFCAISFITYSLNQAELDQVNDKQLSQYNSSIVEQSAWQGTGLALYEHLDKQFDFQFFQYIDSTDSDNSFTIGHLIAQQNDVIQQLYQTDMASTQTLSNGRLQVKLAATEQLAYLSNRYKIQLMLIWGSFLLIAVVSIFFGMHQSKKFKYCAKVIKELPNLTFHTIQKSKLKGEFNLLRKTLETCQVNLKAKVDEFNSAQEKLTRAAFQDPLTGMGTRAKFTEKLNEICAPNSQQLGVLCIVKATELGPINQVQGREAGDKYLLRIANDIRKTLVKSAEALCYRTSTADFAIILPDVSLKDGAATFEQLKIAFDEYQQQMGTDSIAYIGLCPYHHSSDAVSLMTLGDTAASIAQTMGPNSIHVQQQLSGDELFGDNRWKASIDDIIKRKAIKFYAQPISASRPSVESYRELLSRFYNSQGKFLPTTTVIAMAERHGMGIELDKLVVLKTLSMMASTPSITGLLGINISTSSANNEQFVTWLKNLLVNQRHIAARLVFEVSESGMQTNLTATYHFIKEAHSVGARVSIERFGLGFTSFKFFKDVTPDFIKLDGSYTQGIITDPHNQFFVKMIVDIARKLTIRVVATSVENQEEKSAMEQLLVDGLQGYYIAKPNPIDATATREQREMVM